MDIYQYRPLSLGYCSCYKTIPLFTDYKLPKNYKSTKHKNSKAVIKVIDFFKTKPVINKKKCKKCNMCVESCPVKKLFRESGANGKFEYIANSTINR